MTVIIIACLTLACNLPRVAPQQNQTAAAETSQPGGSATTPLPPTVTHIPATPTPKTPGQATLGQAATMTETPLPIITPMITPSTILSVPMLTADKDTVNCRFGPGTEWAPVNSLAAYGSAPILGKSADSGWWLVQLGSTSCWVAGNATTVSGNLGLVAVVGAPQAFITKLRIEAKPVTIHVSGCIFPVPVSYTANIEVNGPLSVEWHLELSQGNITTQQTLTFAKFGSRTLGDGYHVGVEGDYWVKIIIDSPKPMSAKANYKAVCP